MLINRDIVCKSLISMKEFHDELCDLFNRFDLDLLGNLGRRNILMSQAQESFVAKFLTESGLVAVCDGRTGMPDIFLPESSTEIECKLTTRNRSGSIQLQADYETLSKKGSQDFLYYIADDKFEKFCVLYFKGLTTDDFFAPSPGSRNKSRVNKTLAMDKCTVLVGEAINMRLKNISRCRAKLKSEKLTIRQREKLVKSAGYWQAQLSRWSFSLEKI